MMEDNSTPSGAPAESGSQPDSAAQPETAPPKPPLPTSHVGDGHYAGRNIEPHVPHMRFSEDGGGSPPSEGGEG